MTDFECPICMEFINSDKNIIITECGHKFHCKCIMKNIELNGFGCPYCRTEMTDNKENDYDDDDDDFEEERQEDYVEIRQPNSNYWDVYTENYALQGMRWLFAQVQGEDIHETDTDTDTDTDADRSDAETEPMSDSESQISHSENNLPSSGLITQYLSQRGFTMEDLVKCILFEDHRYNECDNYYDELIKSSNKVNGKINAIIHRYRNT